MEKRLKYLLVLFVFLFLKLGINAQSVRFHNPEKGFTSWIPAASADDALLSGNGVVGTMVYGKPHDELIIVDHALSYLPLRIPPKPINQASRLTEIRELLDEGKYTEAAKIPVEQSKIDGYPEKYWTDPYVPVFDIKVGMDPGNVKNYQRVVDFESGEAKVQWEQNGQLFQRRLFVSRADSVIVLFVKSSGKVNCTFEFARHPVEWNQWEYINSTIKDVRIEASKSSLSYRTEFVHQWQGNPQGFEGVGKVIAPGGEVTVKGNSVVVTNTDSVLVLVRVKPSYNYALNQAGFISNQLNQLPENYSTLLERHKKIHGELFNRVKLDLGGGSDSNLDAEAMVLKAHQSVTPAIIEKEFNAARYNIISSAGINPPNLQGIWSATWTPPWSGDFTHDGNVEVAVSSMLSGSTPELMRSYLDYHERMLPYYRVNAKNLFGCRGINIPGHTSSNGYNIHFDDTWCLTFWTGAAGWTASYFYDYYLYTGDKDYLKNHAYLFMKEAAQFYEDFLFKGKDGKLEFSPSYSPENNPANSPSQACINATMDVMIARQLLRNCMAAGELLNEQKAQLNKWKEIISLLPDYRINSDGALQEWMWDSLQDNYHHRHVSHLYALYDLIEPEFKTNQQLRAAAQKAVDYRMDFRRNEHGGEMAFGLVQLGMIAANLGDTDKTEEIINWLAANYWTNSLASEHNPGSLFNMDISGGFPALIIRSLVYSEPGSVWLFPAKPKEWQQGTIEGLSLRGQVSAQRIHWESQKAEVWLTSEINQNLSLQIPLGSTQIKIDGKLVKADSAKSSVPLTMVKGKVMKVSLVLE